MAALVTTIRLLLSHDNAQRNQAEVHYNELVKQSAGDVAKHLLEVLASHRDANDAGLRYVFGLCLACRPSLPAFLLFHSPFPPFPHHAPTVPLPRHIPTHPLS